MDRTIKPIDCLFEGSVEPHIKICPAPNRYYEHCRQENRSTNIMLCKPNEPKNMTIHTVKANWNNSQSHTLFVSSPMQIALLAIIKARGYSNGRD